MAQTPLTTATSYCSVDELFTRHDWRWIADVINDGEGPRPTYMATRTDTAVVAALLDASGELESACLAGERYFPTDLAAMLTNGGAGAGLLIALTGALALWRLYQRRMPLAADPEKVPGAKQALELLERLRTGERIFSFQESADAGLPKPVNPGAMPWNANYVKVTNEACRFFGGPAGGGCGPGYGPRYYPWGC